MCSVASIDCYFKGGRGKEGRTKRLEKVFIKWAISSDLKALKVRRKFQSHLDMTCKSQAFQQIKLTKDGIFLIEFPKRSTFHLTITSRLQFQDEKEELFRP